MLPKELIVEIIKKLDYKTLYIVSKWSSSLEELITDSVIVESIDRYNAPGIDIECYDLYLEKSSGPFCSKLEMLFDGYSDHRLFASCKMELVFKKYQRSVVIKFGHTTVENSLECLDRCYMREPYIHHIVNNAPGRLLVMMSGKYKKIIIYKEKESNTLHIEYLKDDAIEYSMELICC